MAESEVTRARARIACVSIGASPARELIEICANAGYAVTGSTAAANADVGLIDLRGGGVTPRKAAALADALRRKSPESVLAFLVDPAALERGAAPLKRFGEVIPAEDTLDHVAARLREIIRLRNIVEEAGERLKSLTAAHRAVDFPTITTDAAKPRVLMIGSPGPATIEAINAVAGIAELCICVLSAGQAMRALEHETFDVALFLPPEDDDGAVPALVRALKRHHKFSKTALLQIRETADGLAAAARAGGPDFFLREQISPALGGRAQLVARRARLTASMRNFLRACAGEGVRDPASGVFTPAFLTQHGARLAGRADQTGRPLSLVLIRLSDDAGEKNRASRNSLRQAARVLGKITRAEDMASRIAPGVFAVLCPATTIDDAERIALRIEGVLSNTAFQRENEHGAAALNVNTIAVARQHGEAIGETVAAGLRLVNALNQDASARTV